MNILFVMPIEISYGGIETIILGLWKRMLQQGHTVDFVCHGYDEGVFEPEIIRAGSKVFHIPYKKSNYFKAVSGFDKILKQGRYDVVHSNMNAVSGIYLKIAKKNGVPVRVAHSHSSSSLAITSNIFKLVLFVFEKIKTRKYSNVKIACSNKAGKWLFGKEPFIFLTNGIDLNVFRIDANVRLEYRDKMGFSNDDLVIGHVGRFSSEKNHKFVIDLFAELQKENANYKLLLVGDGDLKQEIERHAKEKGVFDSIVFTGNVDDVQDYMQAMDLFVLPSQFEGLGIVGIEAQACGLPVIFSTGVPEDVRVSDNVEFVSTDDMDTWKKKVEEMIVLPRCDNLKKVQSAGFDIEQTAKNMENLYLENCDKS